MEYHTPVLADQVVKVLDPKPDKVFVDATLGNGGHSLLLLQNGATVFGVDQDPSNLKTSTHRIESASFGSKFTPIHSNFSQLSQALSQHQISQIDGLLLDLGLSKNQQTGQDRGFSFNDSQSLDMRLDPQNQTLTAEYVINVYPYEELFKIFSYYAQEQFSKPIALKIIQQRQKSPIKTATRLADIIRQYYQTKSIKTKIDPATKIFMALRIFVNDEYENLKSVLSQSLDLVKADGQVAIITFHSGEDRIVKQFIKSMILSGKIYSDQKVLPTPEEIKSNPLSRSAILRSYRIK